MTTRTDHAAAAITWADRIETWDFEAADKAALASIAHSLIALTPPAEDVRDSEDRDPALGEILNQVRDHPARANARATTTSLPNTPEALEDLRAAAVTRAAQAVGLLEVIARAEG